jgi:DEAD/DEAH box helicase domain-containing protein
LSEKQPSSPKSGTLDSLLPGYLSRPQPSPQKPKQRLAENRLSEEELKIQGARWSPSGGFITKIATTNAGQAKTLLQLASAIDTNSRQQPNVEQKLEEGPAEYYHPSTARLPVATQHIPLCTSSVSIGNYLQEETSLSTLLSTLSPEAIASLPLPSTVLLLESQFRSLCTFYEFFQRHHIQCTFHSIQQSMNNAGVMSLLTLENLEVLARLCPSVLHVSKHLSAADVPENRTDDWRDTNNGNSSSGGAAAAAAAVVDSTEGGTESGTQRAGDGTAAVAEDLLISLVDPWEAKYEAGGSPPVPFLEEMCAAENQLKISLLPSSNATVAGTTAALNAEDEVHAIDGEENGGIFVPAKTAMKSRKRKLSTNKPRRMAWQLRRSLISAMVVLQERYFGDTVPPVLDTQQVQKQTKPRDVNIRRSKAGKQKQKQQAQAAAAAAAEVQAVVEDPVEVISLLDESIQQKSANTPLHNLLELGKWHPLFPLEKIVTLRALKESAEVLQTLQPQHHGSTTGGGSGCGDAVDALNIARNATIRLQQPAKNPPPPSKRARKGPPAPPQLLKKHAPCTDTTQFTAPAFLKHLQSRPGYQGQIVHVETIPERPATLTDLSPIPHLQVLDALRQRNISTLYSHQAEAITHLRSGRHTVIATSTASGKSLCYALPIFETLVADPASCAVLIFPTKALAQDQRKNLNDMAVAAFGADAAPAVEIYDGDTPMDARASIRDKAQLILTNPDMLHLSILPVHSQFSRILSNLKYVVVDEAHSYKGVFGCHAALVLRRLRRVCFRLYNRQPTFAVTTATVANPAQHACTLLGVPEVIVVDKDGSPHGSKEFVLWNPPLKHPELAKAAGEAGVVVNPAPPAAAGDGGSNAADKAVRSRLVSRRAIQESERSAVRAARQERNAGIMLGGPESRTKEEEWTAAVRAGQRDSVVKAKLASLSGSREVKTIAAVPGKESADPPNLPSTSVAAAAAAIEPQQHQPPQQLTSRQRALISHATAAISLASGPSTSLMSSLSQQNGLSGSNNYRGAALGQRRLLKIGTRKSTLITSAVDATTRRNTIDNQDKVEPLPNSLSAKQSAVAKISPGTEARFGSAGVDMTSARTSPIVEIASLLAECVQHGLRTIAFCKTRKLSELVIAYVREILMVTAPEVQTKVAVYRAGYSANERRQIEAALFSGALLGVAATNALELGVDIGKC